MPVLSVPDPYDVSFGHKKYIHSVRDSFSEQMLNSMGITNVINTGCPTMWGITKELCQDISSAMCGSLLIARTK